MPYSELKSSPHDHRKIRRVLPVVASQCFTNILGGDGDADGVKVVLELLPSVTAFWDGNSVCFATGSALFATGSDSSGNSRLQSLKNGGL